MTTRLSLERGTLSRDIALASASWLGGLLMVSLGIYQPLNPGFLDVPAAVPLGTLTAACVAVALRRVATRSGLALGTAAFVVDLVCGSSLATSLVYTQVLFDSCVYGSPKLSRRLLWIALAHTVAAALIGVAFSNPWSWQGVGLAVPAALIGVLPVLGGISVRQYRDQAAAERARAEQTARLAELDRRQAVAAERSRMARELHDVIANHLSAVAIHATAALSVSGLDRAQVDQALRVIRENSVQGLAEMRQMIGLLREPAEGEMGPTHTGAGETDQTDRTDPAQSGSVRVRRSGPTSTGATEPAARRANRTEPPARRSGGTGPAALRSSGREPAGQRADRTEPVAQRTRRVTDGGGRPPEEPARLGAPDGPVRTRLAEVDRLVGQARKAGLSVRFETVGAVRPLPVGVDLAAYRIVQEALTNALKHGSGTATLVVRYHRGSVSLTIGNPFAGPAGVGRTGTRRAEAGLPGAGAGLIGMRERATLLHGRFDAGPQGSDWWVHAELPHAGLTAGSATEVERNRAGTGPVGQERPGRIATPDERPHPTVPDHPGEPAGTPVGQRQVLATPRPLR